MNEKPSVLRSTRIVSICTGLSRFLGLVRMMLMANLFGTSLLNSAFVLAFRIPNLFRRLFGEGALAAAFIPVFTECIEKEGLKEANRLAARVMTMLGTILGAVVLMGMLIVTVWMGAGNVGARTAAVLPLLRIMLPYMFFICMVALSMGMLNSRGHFFTPAATPVLLNVIWIALLLFVCPMFEGDHETQIRIVAWGILVAGVVQLLAQMPALLKFGIRPGISFAWRDERVNRILLLVGPVALTMGVFQINTLVGTILAMMVDERAPSALQYAELVIYTPLGLFATALGTVLLPTYSRYAAREEPEKLLSTFNFGFRSIMFIMLPAAAGLLVLARPVIEVLFERGAFDAQSTVYTARALLFYAPGLVVFSLYKVFVPAFYAVKDTKTPFVTGVIAVAINFLLTLLFVLVWPEGFKHAGIAFASVISSAFNCVVLGVMIHRKLGNPGWGCIAGSVGRFFLLTLVMALAVYYVRGVLEHWNIGVLERIGSITLVRTFHLLMGIIAGIAVYFALAYIFCREELCEFRNS